MTAQRVEVKGRRSLQRKGMASGIPLDNWERNELDNPIGDTALVMNPVICELAVRHDIEVADGEWAPWFYILSDIESVVLLEGIVSICN